MIRHRPNGNWQIVVFVRRDPVTGKEIRARRTVPGTKDQKRPPKAARELEAQLLLEVKRGQHRTKPRTLAEFLDEWLAHICPDRSPSTMTGYQGCVDRYLRPQIGHVRLDRLTVPMLDDLYRRLQHTASQRRSGLSGSTVRHVHALLRSALNDAQRWGYVDTNVAKIAKSPSARPVEVDPPTVAEVRRILAAAYDWSDDLGDVVALGLTGMRRSEICGLRWSDIDLQAGVVRIRRAMLQEHRRLLVKDTKTARSRRGVSIGPMLVALLEKRRVRRDEIAAACATTVDPDGYVLSESPDCTEAFPPDRITDQYGNLVRRIGLATRFHDLRHFVATNLLASGVAPHNVAAHLGHAQVSMTLDVYGHPSRVVDPLLADITDQPFAD